MKPCPCCGKEPELARREFVKFAYWHDCELFYLETQKFYPSEIQAEEAWDKIIESLGGK